MMQPTQQRFLECTADRSLIHDLLVLRTISWCLAQLLIVTAINWDGRAVWAARRWPCVLLTGVAGAQGSARVIRCLQDHREELQIECSTALFDQEVRGATSEQHGRKMTAAACRLHLVSRAVL